MKEDHTEIYKMFTEISGSLGEIKGELKGVNQRLDTVNGRLGSHSRKINDLESFRDTLKGKVAIVSTIIGTVVAFITSILVKKL